MSIGMCCRFLRLQQIDPVLLLQEHYLVHHPVLVCVPERLLWSGEFLVLCPVDFRRFSSMSTGSSLCEVPGYPFLSALLFMCRASLRSGL